jgi:hypothetical protein
MGGAFEAPAAASEAERAAAEARFGAALQVRARARGWRDRRAAARVAKGAGLLLGRVA